MSDIQITPKDWNIDGSIYKPGDRLILNGGLRNELLFRGLKGTAEAPIVITATEKLLIKGIVAGGRVVTFSGCSHIRFTGGNGRLIEITGGGQAVDFRELSTNLEVDHLYIHHVGYLFIAAKTDVTADPKTWRGNFTMRGVHIHDNILDSTVDGEGMYIGLSHYATNAKEHEVEDVIIEDNVIRNVGADAIQVGACVKNCQIRRNEITNFGTKKVWGQSSGIQANPGTLAVIEDNVIDGGTSFGLILQGRSGSIARRNLVINTNGGIMTVAREATDKGTFTVEKNTFISISGNLLEMYSNTNFRNNVANMASALTQAERVYSGVFVNTDNKIGSLQYLGLDANYVPTATSVVPAGTGYKDYVKPAPVVTKEPAIVELITTDGIQEWWISTPSGKRKKIE